MQKLEGNQLAPKLRRHRFSPGEIRHEHWHAGRRHIRISVRRVQLAWLVNWWRLRVYWWKTVNHPSQGGRCGANIRVIHTFWTFLSSWIPPSTHRKDGKSPKKVFLMVNCGRETGIFVEGHELHQYPSLLPPKRNKSLKLWDAVLTLKGNLYH